MSTKIKKIGCVIAYNENHNNYGTSLQGYATIKKIQELGFDCEIIRYDKKLSFFKKIYLLFIMLRIGEKSKIRRIKNKIYSLIYKGYRNNIAIRTQSVNAYKKEKLIPLFKTYYGYKDLKHGSLNYDAVVVGSDQVWTPMSLYSKYFNLLFVDDSIPKIAYASSFGVSDIPNFQKKETKNYLDRFHKIGVREISGKNIVDNLSNNKATVVADPTILLTKEEWEDEIHSSELKVDNEPYIFCYLLGNNDVSRKAVNEIKFKTGYKVVVIRHMDEYVFSDESFGDYAPYNVSPIDFVKLISNAEYICTDSFHCSVFSIIFHRKFLTFYRFNAKSKNSRNSRIDSLFSLLGIEKRLFENGEAYNQIIKEINYANVDKNLNTLRENSFNFLKTSLMANLK